MKKVIIIAFSMPIISLLSMDQDQKKPHSRLEWEQVLSGLSDVEFEKFKQLALEAENSTLLFAHAIDMVLKEAFHSKCPWRNAQNIHTSLQSEVKKLNAEYADFREKNYATNEDNTIATLEALKKFNLGRLVLQLASFLEEQSSLSKQINEKKLAVLESFNPENPNEGLQLFKKEYGTLPQDLVKEKTVLP